MRPLLVLLLLCGIAHAAPKYQHTPSTSTDPTMVAAERKWTIADASRGPAQRDLWEDAASAFIAIVDAGKLPKADLALAAHTALLAYRNSLNADLRVKSSVDDEQPDYSRGPVARPLTARDQRMMHLLEVAARYETDPIEVAGLDFLRANLYRRNDHLDEATAIYLDLVAKHPTHEVAGYSASLVLDNYNRAQKYDAMTAFTIKLRADKHFLASHPDLAKTVTILYARQQGLVARRATQLARETGDHKHFETCAEAYLSILDPTAPQKTDDEVLYNAMICFEQAGSTDRALTTLRRLTKDFPDSLLTKRADLHSISMLATVGRYDDAATAGEQWLRTSSIERDAPDVLEDTIRWRIASGSLDAAVRILEDYTTRVRRLPQRAAQRAFVAITLAASILDDARSKSATEYSRRRAVAVRILSRPPPLSRTFNADGAARVAVASVYAAAACPIALADGLCTRPRDAALMATARRELTRSPNPNDGATLFLADLALEAILTNHAPTANLSADYEHLTFSSDPEIRVAAHARLAALAHHMHNAPERTKQLEACIADSYASHAGDTWRAICERDLSLAAEVLPPPHAPAPIALEPPLVPPPPPPHADQLNFEE